MNLKTLLARVSRRQREQETAQRVEAGLQAELQRAHREWQAARAYFDHVTEPDLVDVAIYNLEAAQRRYTYLLRRFKQEF